MVSKSGSSNWMIIYGLIIHLLFLGSIFVIYFKSPVVRGLHAQNDLDDPVAQRLVLFVSDGLRAESLLRDDWKRTPFLRNVTLSRGMFGISHTRVPTESRPGHIALIAGLYEDPSAVTRGWQENPIEFDSLFNRSEITYSWGSPDILPIFSKKASPNKVFAYSYNPNEEDFSGKESTKTLDLWVFERVEKFIDEHLETLKHQKKLILFLHLLGLDTAGHIHKPNSRLFNENLVVVDSGIKRISEMLEEKLDKRTAFVFTADHGMTDQGSHGAGQPHETETPIIAWGAGVNSWTNLKTLPEKHWVELGGVSVPAFDVEQADLTPLMASLIGIAVPANNYGKLPMQYINATEEYKCKCLLNNALQIAAQYKMVLFDFDKGAFSKYLLKYELTMAEVDAREAQIKASISKGNFNDAMHLCETYIRLTLNGITFYQSYYQRALLAAVTVSYLGWICRLMQIVFDISKKSRHNVNRRRLYLIAFALEMTLALCFYAQNAPLDTILYMLLPVVCWIPPATNFDWKALKRFAYIQHVLYFIIFVIFIELLVLSFFYRPTLTVLVILLPFLNVSFTEERYRMQMIKNFRFFGWMFSCILLAVFPMLPTLQKNSQSTFLLIIGLFMWGVQSAVLIKKYSNRWTLLATVLHLLSFGNVLQTVYTIESMKGLLWHNQIISWILMVTSFMLPVFGTRFMMARLRSIMQCISIPYLLMSISYEPIFLLAFCFNIHFWIQVESDRRGHDPEELSFYSSGILNRPISKSDFKLALTIMLYIFISFFGTGNMASVSSFDPNWVRCFVATFSPFTMAFLIIIKLLIPIIITVCGMQAAHVVTKAPQDKIFSILLLICDVMALNFLFFVKNEGSWLEIGITISHFVILEFTILFLYLINLVVKWMTTVQLTFKTSVLLPEIERQKQF